MKDVLLNLGLGIITGLITGLISGYIVTVHYRNKDLEKEFILYCERLLKYATCLSNTFMPLKLVHMDASEIIKTLTDMDSPRKYSWLKIPKNLKKDANLVNDLENDCREFFLNLLEYSQALMWSLDTDTTAECREQHAKIRDEKSNVLDKKWMDLFKDIAQFRTTINGDEVSKKRDPKC